MKTKIMNKIMGNVAKFVSLPLTNARILEEKDKKTGKNLLILELVFSDKGLLKTMVLLLDKDLTEGNYTKLADRLTR